MSLRKSSKRTNPEWHFKIFTFASQRRLVELLSYGEYNHLFIFVICFLKTTHLSVHRFQWLNFFFHYENIVHLHHFSAVEKYWSQQHWIIYNWINFSQGYPCCGINFRKQKIWKFHEASVQKFFLTIISIIYLLFGKF